MGFLDDKIKDEARGLVEEIIGTAKQQAIAELSDEVRTLKSSIGAAVQQATMVVSTVESVRDETLLRVLEKEKEVRKVFDESLQGMKEKGEYLTSEVGREIAEYKEMVQAKVQLLDGFAKEVQDTIVELRNEATAKLELVEERIREQAEKVGSVDSLIEKYISENAFKLLMIFVRGLFRRSK